MFFRGLKLKIGILHISYKQSREEFQFESYGILYYSADDSNQANRSIAHIFYAYLATLFLKMNLEVTNIVPLNIKNIDSNFKANQSI